MIIFGTRGLTSTRQSGSFHCPRCGPGRQFELKEVRRFFTLYFIPLIPLGKAGEYVECKQCAGTFGAEVIHYDPGAARQQALDEIRRLLFAVVTGAGPVSEDRLTKLHAALGRVGGVEDDVGDLRRALQAVADQGVPLAAQLRGAGAGLSDEGKGIVLYESYRILADRGRLTPAARTTFQELGVALGIQGKRLDDLMQTLREKTS